MPATSAVRDGKQAVRNGGNVNGTPLSAQPNTTGTGVTSTGAAANTPLSSLPSPPPRPPLPSVMSTKAGKNKMARRKPPTPTQAQAQMTTTMGANVPDHVVSSAPIGKKKKKKRGRGKSTTMSATATIFYDGEGRELSVPPEFEASYKSMLPSFAHTRTGLSPDLESVHLSTTESLSNHHHTHLSANVDLNADVIAEMCRSVGIDVTGPAEGMEGEMQEGPDKLPSMRDIMKTCLAEVAEMTPGGEDVKQQAMQSFAKHLLHGGGISMNLGPGVGVNVEPLGRPSGGGGKNGNGTRSMNVNINGASTLDPGTIAFTKALEQWVSGEDSTPSHGSEGAQTTLHANVVVSHEYHDGEGDIFEDEYFSDYETDERRIEGEGGEYADREKASSTYAQGWTAEMGGVYGEYDEDAPPGGYPHTEGAMPEQEGKPRQKNRKRKKTGEEYTNMEGVTDAREKCLSPKTNNGPPSLQHSSSTTSPPFPSMPPLRKDPPPSSRAAGKQPMAYAPATTAPNTAPTNTAPPRSARAAAKAPAPPQSYHSHPHPNPSPPASNVSAPQKHRPPGASNAGSAAAANSKSNNKIWNTNTAEERERIKEFWLGLSEKERRALVEIEKETVLKRMKEQQKHSCTCAVCGRKRHAIEEELEVLYDAYYEELEQYANYQQRYASSGGTIPPPPGPGPFPGSVELDKDGRPIGPGKTHAHSHPPSARTKAALTNGPRKGITPESEFEDDEPSAEEYDDEGFDEDEGDEEEDVDEDVDEEDDVGARHPRSVAPRHRNRGAPNGKANGRDDLFSFSTSFTSAPGNILTVADDLLKNDGQKFLEMMEQLAERRMQREEDAAADVEDDSEVEEVEEVDEEDDREEDEDDDDDEEDEEDLMTEEQKIAEGKRMFSIFAARMFEQRVLSAYREKVAQERQRQLLRELEEEESAKSQREAKKAKENQKKKDKKRQQKMAKEEERAAKAAERAAEEAAQRERAMKLEEEQRKKREEERAKREAARKAAEEERQRKEEERRKRLEAEREAQAERERKRKEKEEKQKAERKEREERERKVREEKEAKLAAERAEKAKKDQLEKEEREKRLAKEKEDKDKAERDIKSREQQPNRNTGSKGRPPSSPRTNSSASGSRQQQQQNPMPKKILNKSSSLPSALAASTPPVQTTRQPSRPVVTTAQNAQQSQQSVSSPTVPPNLPPSTPTFPQGNLAGMPPPILSPPQRAPFPTASGVPSYPGYPGQIAPPPPPLGPSPIPRSFGTGPPFEPGFGRGLASAATPIGPPSKGMPNAITSPIMPPGSAVPARRVSNAADPGPITRPIPAIAPIAPIARPNGINGDSSGSAPGSGGASPSRFSPSPKGQALGSSALVADDDEVVAAPSRRVAPGPVGQGWHSPRSSVAMPTPWGSSAAGSAVGTNAGAPGQSFSPSRSGSGAIMQFGVWSSGPAPVLPPGVSLSDWQAPHHPGAAAGVGAVGAGVGVGAAGMGGVGGGPGTPFFGASPFIHPNHSAATPPPHSSAN